MKVTSNNEQKVPVTLEPKTASGKPAPVDGVPTWVVLEGNATVDVAADGLSAYLVSADDIVETSQIEVTVDADMGTGVKPIKLLLEYEVTSPMVENLGATIGQPEPKVTA